MRAHLTPEGGCGLNIGPWPTRPLLRERKRRGKGGREGFKTGPWCKFQSLPNLAPEERGSDSQVLVRVQREPKAAPKDARFDAPFT